MYSGKIAVPPGGGGIVHNFNSKGDFLLPLPSNNLLVVN
jgi:hypothetical protein